MLLMFCWLPFLTTVPCDLLRRHLQDLLDGISCAEFPDVYRSGVLLAAGEFEAVVAGSRARCGSNSMLDHDACKALVNVAYVFLSSGKFSAAERCCRVALHCALETMAQHHDSKTTNADAEEFGDSGGA